MTRLACLLALAVAACSGSGFETGAASVTSVMPVIKSAAAVSFTGADGAGTMVLGWTIDLYDKAPGTDCQSSDVHPTASLGIFTNQPPGTHPKAQLSTGDISIVATSPPTVNGTAAATMGAPGISTIVGTVTITEFHLKPDGKTADKISGTLNAGGTDASSGTGVALTGMFAAPICE